MRFFASLVEMLIGLYSLVIIARVFMDLMRVDPYHPVARFLYQATEPLLAPLRERIPPMGMIDISPMVALLLLWILERILVALLLGMG